MFCNMILTPVVMIIRTLVQVITTVLQTICGWVNSVISTVQQVISQSCSSWGWFSWICEAVVTLINVVQTVTNWVCNTVTNIIVSVIEVISEIVIFVAKWVCWLIDLVPRIIEMLFCRFTAREKFIHVCVKILANGNGQPSWTLQQVDAALNDANGLFAQCNIKLVKCDVHIVEKPEYLNELNIGIGFFLSMAFSWFSSNTCGCCSRLTIYFLNSMTGAEGFSVPGCDWVLISHGPQPGLVVPHEIGHLADLTHSSDPQNVMVGTAGVYGTKFTRFQCCMLRTARFTNYNPKY